MTAPSVSDYLRFVTTNGARALEALGDPMRQRILEQLSASPSAVGELAAALPISRPAVSQHLRVLKEARLVADTAVGTRRIYRVDPQGLDAIRARLDEFWDGALQAFAEAAQREHDEAQR